MKMLVKEIRIVTVLMIIFSFLFTGCEQKERLKSGINSEPPKILNYALASPLKDLSIRTYVEERFTFYMLDSCDLSEIDLSQLSVFDLNYRTHFDNQTIWPNDLPNDFNPDELLESGKGVTFGVDYFHEQGITGKGVGIAIIDAPILLDHEEYVDNIKMYYSYVKEDMNYTMPSSTKMVSNLAGKTSGYAPDVSIYYIASPFRNEEGEFSADYYIKNIEMLISFNKTIVEDKIKLIIIPTGVNKDMENYDQFIKVIEKAEKNGIHVLTPIEGNELLMFSGLSKLPYAPVDDINSYYVDSSYVNYYNAFNTLLVPTNGRTFASCFGKNDYAYISDGMPSLNLLSSSIAGLYALSLQIKPDLTFDEFMNLLNHCRSTTVVEKEGEFIEIKGIVNPEKLYNLLIQ